MEEEKTLDAFIAKANDATTEQDPVVQGVASTDEDIVEAKARQKGGKQSASILQKRTTISETDLEKRIAGTLRKYPDIMESELRGDLAKRIEQNGENSDVEDITEEQYSGIVNSHVKRNEQPTPDPQGPLIQPPPFASQTIQGIQDKVSQAADRASGLSTPGGVGILIFVLMFFIWAIIPVSNGKTRLQLLWAVLTNQAYFPDDTKGASGYFGDGSIPDANIVNVPPSRQNGGGTVGPTLVPYVPSFEQDEW